jgi:hypothetical protein
MPQNLSTEKIIKILFLMNSNVLISQIEEVGSDIGEPDCKLIDPFVINEDKTLHPFLCGYTKQNTFMMSSDKILTLADPTPTLLEKYEDLIKE